jgi:hypothetical protein
MSGSPINLASISARCNAPPTATIPGQHCLQWPRQPLLSKPFLAWSTVRLPIGATDADGMAPEFRPGKSARVTSVAELRDSKWVFSFVGCILLLVCSRRHRAGLQLFQRPGCWAKHILSSAKRSRSATPWDRATA